MVGAGGEAKPNNGGASLPFRSSAKADEGRTEDTQERRRAEPCGWWVGGEVSVVAQRSNGRWVLNG